MSKLRVLTPILLAALASAAAAQSEPTWSPETPPTVMNPAENTSLSAWEPYKISKSSPSQDQELDDPILDGAIDIHAHYGPDTYNRQWNAFEIASRAQAHNMRGVVLKSHWTATADIAQLAHQYAAPDMEVWGGLVLNTTVGGINPMAVRAFAETSGGKAKIVWMPTHDSEHEVRFLGEARPFVRVSDQGKLLPQVFEVLDLIKQYDLTLATGHVEPEEMIEIVKAARDRGIEKIIITHPGLGDRFSDPTVEQVAMAVDLGAHAEVVASELLRDTRDVSIELIRAVGPSHCIISTDSGIVGTPNHTDAMVMAAKVLRDAGFSEDDLNVMFKTNPARVLGLLTDQTGQKP